jgi:hypothetical protein
VEGQGLHGCFGNAESPYYMARARPDVSADRRDRELRKIAQAFRALADGVEADERNRELLHPRKAMRAERQIRCYHSASGLLMDALALGGPQDEGLLRILRSWRDRPTARRECFVHVCAKWPPLRRARVVPRTSDLLACARAMRVIADGIWREPLPDGTSRP